MRVLVVSQYFWPEHFVINNLVERLTKQGVHVCVLTGKPNYPDGKVFDGYRVLGMMREHYAGADVVRVPIIPRSGGSALRLVLNYVSFMISACVIAPLALRDRRFDVVFVYAPSPVLQALPGILLARLKKIPLVVWVQDLWPESLKATGYIETQSVLRAVGRVVRYIYCHANSILIQSEAFREPVARLTDDPSRIRYFPNIVDPPLTYSSSSLSDGVAAEIRNAFSLVFAGNIGTAQSIETILAAAEWLESEADIKFYIIGGGSRQCWLKEETKRRNLRNVVFTGRLPATEMPAIYAAASALLVVLRSSPVLAATIPSKLQACLAAGRPIIASMDGEGARLVRLADAGLTCPADDPASLAAAVKRLKAFSPEERTQLGRNGQRYFYEHFDPTKWTQELITHFEQITDSKRTVNR